MPPTHRKDPQPPPAISAPDSTPAASTGSSTPQAHAPQVAREIGGIAGPEPTRFGDWEKNGRCIDF